MLNDALKKQLFSLNLPAVVMATLGFWLSASLLLDFVIMPVLSMAGMMNDRGFLTAGYLLFGVFNRLEVVCAATILTAFFGFRSQHLFSDRQALNGLVIASILFNITLIYTYLITPHLTGFSLEMLDFAEVTTMPLKMFVWHGLYWALEATKFILGVILLRWCYRQTCAIT
ncbi:hypothetical protein NIES970_18260 [[Synechococcus] sp. NIES-970]|uniref:hypothetical protein n=1 Tax=Picosynechococcus sp. NKBG15041c TaxID=1407650 RepID=UPI000423CD01|nr:hypothetical protein [Picosynechococcus sp. NKBG15041c]BAW96884.1 hypothetical protein NIES970_18260 [[Synechococcus] sp. NIES-970]